MAMDAWGGRIRLRPLGVGDVLDETFRVYKRQFIPLITVMAVVVVPVALLSLIVTLVTGAGSTSLFERLSMGATIVALLAIVVLAVVASLAQLVAAGAAVRVASDGILGRPVSVGEAYRDALGSFGSMLVVGFVAGIPITLLVITCIGIPVAIFLGLGWALVFQAILLEGQGAIDAMRRSWELVGGHRWRLLACVLLIGLITALLVSIPTGLFGFLAGIWLVATGGSDTAMLVSQIGNVVFNAAGQTLFGAIGYITTTLLYYDLRVRKEAFDLEQRLPQADVQGYPQYHPQGQQYPQNSPQIPTPPQAPPGR
jgi:hypothetical protein